MSTAARIRSPVSTPVSARFLARRALLALPLGGRGTIRCLRGRLWVTAPGTGDIVLDPGEFAELYGKGRLVIEALSDAQLDVELLDE